MYESSHGQANWVNMPTKEIEREGEREMVMKTLKNSRQ